MAVWRYDDMINARTIIEILCATIRASSMYAIVIPRLGFGQAWDREMPSCLMAMCNGRTANVDRVT